MTASLQHCRPGRCLQLPCRAEQPSRPQQQAPAAQGTTRRSALGAALLLPAAAAAAAAAGAAPRAACAAEELAPGVPAVLEEAAEVAALDVPNWPRWVDRNFSFSYPRGLKEVQDLNYGKPPLPRAGAEQVQENPLKAEVRSADDQQRINVIVKQSTTFKRTLLQVTDITMLGDSRSVAKLLLPAGATVLDVEQITVEQPPRDTGTVLGVIQRDPVNYYSYEVMLADRTHLQMTAAAQLGQLYVLGASVPDSQWAECGAGLKEAARSFRLRYRWM